MSIRRLFIALLLLLLSACESGKTSTVSVSTSNPVPPELSIVEYPLNQMPEAESSTLHFADSVQGDPRLINVDRRGQPLSFENSFCTEDGNHYLAMCNTLGSNKLIAFANYNIFGSGYVRLTLNGKRIYRIAVGRGSPISPLRGLWAYDGHWALETAYVKELTEGNTVISDAVGQVSVDGELLNKQFDYAETFGFQTIRGKPFYFFKRGGKIEASYDSVEIALGYDEIPHYGCCSAATLNPQMFQNMVAFYARKVETWYYVEIGVFNL